MNSTDKAIDLICDYENENINLKNRITELEAVAYWIPVDERLPDHTEMVEVATWIPDNVPPYWALSHGWYNAENKVWVVNTSFYEKVQYWRETGGRALDGKK